MLTILVKGRQCVAVDDLVGIANDNKSETVAFIFEEMPYEGTVSVKTQLGRTMDKIILTQDSENTNTYLWKVESKTIPITGYMSCQLEILDGEVVWQSEEFILRVSRQVNSNGEIEEAYPSVLLQIQAELDRLADEIGITYYTFAQNEAASTWIITHPLKKMPAVTVVDSAGNVVMGEVTYIDENTVQIRFNGAFSGKAYLN